MDYSKCKVLYVDSYNIVKNDILWGFLELGFDISRLSEKVHLHDYYEEEVLMLERKIEEYHYVFSQNFSINIAEACHRKNRIYVSWLYDSPQIATYHTSALYETSIIFAFDAYQVERLKKNGCKSVYHQPLAANVKRVMALDIKDEEINKYKADVSFVGKIYGQPLLKKALESASDNVRSDIKKVYSDIAMNWNKEVNALGYVSEEVIDYLYNYVDKSYIGQFDIDKRFYTEILFITQALAEYERMKMLKVCSEKYDMHLYTNSDTTKLNEISRLRIHPPVGYEEEVFKVYFATKINMNLTLRSIETGVPQRIFDVMSIGGTVFSNYQKEAEELFVPEKEIVLFKTEDEMLDKIEYYLKHDDERVKIGINAFYRVRDEYTYANALKNIFEVIQHEKL